MPGFLHSDGDRLSGPEQTFGLTGVRPDRRVPDLADSDGLFGEHDGSEEGNLIDAVGPVKDYQLIRID